LAPIHRKSRESKRPERRVSSSLRFRGFVKPLDLELLKQEAEAHRFVVTVEEHVLLGGFGSAVTEALTKLRLQLPILMIGLPDLFIEQGTQAELKARYHIDVEGIVSSIRNFTVTSECIF
jgi:1-deoxy-D-xylulose-5-phosphate synthase